MTLAMKVAHNERHLPRCSTQANYPVRLRASLSITLWITIPRPDAACPRGDRASRFQTHQKGPIILNLIIVEQLKQELEPKKE